VPTDILIEGQCSIWKNQRFQNRYHARFLHDTDLAIFKIISGGNNLFSFRAQEIAHWNKSSSGLIRKKLVTTLIVKFPNFDEYGFEFESRDQASYQRAKEAISMTIQIDLAYSEILRILKLQERVPIQDVCRILTRFNMPNSFEDGRNAVELLITTDKVQGVIDGKNFVTRLVLERESVKYEIVAKFELTASGALILRCPGCGASLQLERKESTGKCAFCGSPYIVPKRLLDLI
jgi:hypothetical protein